MADEQSNQNLADSIAMLEQILEVMPQDIEALKAVYTAYERGGERDRAFDYLIRLSEAVAGGQETEHLAYVQAQFEKFEASHPSEVAARLARLRLLEPDEPVAEPTAAVGEPDAAASARPVETDISEELALAWRLYEENQLSQEEYSSVLHDLTEVSSKELEVPASVLHVLNDRGFTQMSRIMNYLSTRSSTPFISLENFELTEKAAEALPIGFAANDGALPFGYMGNDLLIAVLNPFNNELVDRVENESGHHCHTYLVDPSDYDAALERLRGKAKAA